MALQKRAYNLIPENLRTKQNQREYAILDDTMFEPEQAQFLSGYIGTGDLLSATDLSRTPLIQSSTDPARNKYALSVGVVQVNQTSGAYTNGVFFDELVDHLQANGAITSNQNRLLETPYYALSIPIDYDKHINYSRYFWTGTGISSTDGDYIIKEPEGSLTQIYQLNNNSLTLLPVTICQTYPLYPTYGELIELTTDPTRSIQKWNGTAWVTIKINVVADNVGLDLTDYTNEEYIYVTRTGPNYNRPLIWCYKSATGRWVSMPVVVNNTTPDTPSTGMIWEDTTNPPFRIFRIYDGVQWQKLTYTGGLPSGTPTNNTYVYDYRNLSSITDGWAANNWWRHFDDLSPADRSYVAQKSNTGQALRPIIEFWAGIEVNPTLIKNNRNQNLQFTIYGCNSSSSTISQYNNVYTTLFQYQTQNGIIDSVLGFSPVQDEYNAYQFDITLETDNIVNSLGYRFFKDTYTGYLHGIWEKSITQLQQSMDSNGLYSVSQALTNNSNHIETTTVSRTNALPHYGSVINSQVGFTGNEYGINSYRYTDKNNTLGAIIIDPENSLLRSMSLLQDSRLYITDVIRNMSYEYNRVIGKFITKMNQLWNTLTINDVTGTLKVTTEQAVDLILSNIFIGRNNTFPFYYSNMGTYNESRISSTYVVTITNNTPQPIYIPPSAPRIGATSVYNVHTFTDNDGISKIMGHDGTVMPSWGDNRDLLWLELQNRFFNAVPSYKSTENSSFSVRNNSAQFFLRNYFGNFSPVTTQPNVSAVVDYTYNVTSPISGQCILTIIDASYNIYNGSSWSSYQLLVDDIIYNTSNSTYYMYNGVSLFPINSYNRNYSFDYSIVEFKQIIKRDFERWSIYINDIFDNTNFNNEDPFTYNYSSAGIEGHYYGIYWRIYNTIRPHSHPWEIQGYYIEPSWWRTTYVPSYIASDGTPRYTNINPMWTALQNATNPLQQLVGPIPVDANGNLLDPINAGIVDPSILDTNTISNNFIYGDLSPNEYAFYESQVFPFSCSMAGYLMKHTIFVDSVWQDYNIYLTGNVFNGPHVVNKNTLTRPQISQLPLHLQLNNNVITQNIGLNSWISEYVTNKGNTVNNLFVPILDYSIPTIGWRANGFLNASRTTVKTIGGIQIPAQDVNILYHQAPIINEVFASGIAITRNGTGFNVYGYDNYNSYFMTDMGVYSSNNNLVEITQDYSFNNSYTFYLTNFVITNNSNFNVLIDGQKIQSKFITVNSSTQFTINSSITIPIGTIITASIITVTTSPSTQLLTFTVQGHQFSYNGVASGNYTKIEYGHFFESPSDVINCIIGYGRYLDSLGFVFESKDSDTNDNNDWLLTARKFAVWAIRTANINAPITFYYSPFSYNLKYVTDFGLILDVETIKNGTYGVLDQTGSPIDPYNLTISRVDDTMEISAINGYQIYGARLFITSAQHAIFFPQVTKFGNVLYDPTISLITDTFYIDTYISSNWVGRYNAAGTFISGNTMYPNFEKQAFDITRYYNPNNPTDNVLLRDQARNLFNYAPTTMTYLDDLNIDDRQRFKFYQEMIRTKGTIQPINAFLNGTVLGVTNANITEDWAWANTEYGDTNWDFCQFNIFKSDFVENRQIFEFPQNITTLPTGIANIIPLARTPNENNIRWILGPKNTYSGPGNLIFPTNSGTISKNYKFLLELFDTTNTVTQKLYYWNPLTNNNDPLTVSLLDTISYYDPAIYNSGTSAQSGAVPYWGVTQVGKLWWDQSQLQYTDYTSLSDIKTQAQEWGKPLYYRATLSLTSNTVTVTTLDPITKSPVNHNLTTGQLVDIVGANPTDYNQTQVAITVLSSTQFTYIIQSNPNPATGDIQVIVGQVAIYEWIEAPVSPDQYETYVAGLTGVDQLSGTPRIDGSAYSYIENTTTDSYGNITTYYYYWVRHNTRTNVLNNYSTQYLESRLTSLDGAGIGWFAPINSDTMIVTLAPGTIIDDGYSIGITIDGRKQESHVEWSLISEGEKNNYPPTVISTKILDCLCGSDQFGNPVPNTALSLVEQIGNDYNPAQTIFTDNSLALTQFIDVFNYVFNYQLFDDDTIVSLFSLDYETASNSNGFWTRTAYRQLSYLNSPISDYVNTLTELNTRLSSGLYGEGSIVYVQESGTYDLWDSTNQVGSTYYYDGTQWNVIGIDNWTVSINSNIINFIPEFRNIWNSYPKLLSESDTNYIIMTMLKEMLRQNTNCYWFFKTSYINIEISDTFSNENYVKIPESDAIISLINDVIPFHTNLRDQITSYSLPQPDACPVGIEEFPDDEIILLFDRTSTNTIDTQGYSVLPYDLQPYDDSIIYYPILGTTQFITVGTITGNGVKTNFIFYPEYRASLYNNTYNLYDNNNNLITASSILMTITINSVQNNIIITTSYPLPVNYKIVVMQAEGFVQGITTSTLPPEVLELFPDLSMYPSSYTNAAERSSLNGHAPWQDQVGKTFSDGESLTGDNSEERLPTEFSSSTIMKIDNYYSTAYRGYDVVPYDTLPYDTNGSDLGNIIFYQMSNKQLVIQSGTFVMQLSEQISVVNHIANGTINGTIVAVYYNNGTSWVAIPSIGYTVYPNNPNIVYLNNVYTSVYLIYNNLSFGEIGTYNITQYNSSLPTADFDIINNLLTFSTIPNIGDTVTLYYPNNRFGSEAKDIILHPDFVVNDSWATHTLYDSTSGFDTNRPIGYTVLDQSNNNLYQWSGTAWSNVSGPTTGQLLLVLNEQQLYSWNGTSYTLIYTNGDNYTNLPLTDFPIGGLGIGYLAYIGGQLANSSVLYPESYELTIHNSTKYA